MKRRFYLIWPEIISAATPGPVSILHFHLLMSLLCCSAGSWWATTWLRLTSPLFPVSSYLFLTHRRNPTSNRLLFDQNIHDTHTERCHSSLASDLSDRLKHFPWEVGQLLSLVANVTCHASNRNRVSACTPPACFPLAPTCQRKEVFR